MQIHDIKQGTTDWLELRKGKLTGTTSKNVVGYKEKLKAELVEEAIERGLDFDEKKIKVDELKDLLEDHDPSFSSKVMEMKFNEDFNYKMLATDLFGDEVGAEKEENPLQRGTSLEPIARKRFEVARNKVVDEVGFVSLDEEPRIGLSPDGLIKNDQGVYTEGVEIKCPCNWKYLKYWLEDSFPEEYKDQCLDYFVQSEEIEKVYLVIYNPNVDFHPIHVYTLLREGYAKDILMLKRAQLLFWKQHDERVSKIKLLEKTLNANHGK